MPKRVYLVGHCSPDSTYLMQAVLGVDASAAIKRINDDATLAKVLEESPGPDLLLVNRQLDGLFNTYEGVQLIAAVRGSHPEVKLMLISDYPDAQAAAERAGAVSGFGKSDLRTPIATHRLAAAIGM